MYNINPVNISMVFLVVFVVVVFVVVVVVVVVVVTNKHTFFPSYAAILFVEHSSGILSSVRRNSLASAETATTESFLLFAGNRERLELAEHNPGIAVLCSHYLN